MPHAITLSTPDVESAQTVTLTLDGAEHVIGRITNFNNMFLWNPAEALPCGMQIASTTGFRLEHIVDLLEHCISRQIDAYRSGKPLDVDTLHPDLRSHIRMLSFGLMIKHPLCGMSVYAPVFNAQANAVYKHTRKVVAQALAEKNWNEYVFRHERAWRFDAFQTIAHRLAPTKFWDLLRSVWIDSDNIYESSDMWMMYWSSGQPHRYKAMSLDERKKLASLPEVFTIYRGTDRRKAGRGLSWTLDIKRAKWFANRRSFGSNHRPYLSTATVRRDKVLAYFTSRSENEIVILPDDCEKIVTKRL